MRQFAIGSMSSLPGAVTRVSRLALKQTLKRPPRMSHLSHRCNEVHDHSVQALEQVGVGVDARGREAAEGAREVEQEVALAEVAAPVLEGDDGVRVLVEHLWQG